MYVKLYRASKAVAKEKERPLLPMWCYYLSLFLAVAMLALSVGDLAYDLTTDTGITSGTVIQKIGHNGGGYNDVRSHDGWFVLVQNGNTYQLFQLTKEQYEQVDVDARIWRVGPWTLWKNLI